MINGDNFFFKGKFDALINRRGYNFNIRNPRDPKLDLKVFRSRNDNKGSINNLIGKGHGKINRTLMMINKTITILNPNTRCILGISMKTFIKNMLFRDNIHGWKRNNKSTMGSDMSNLAVMERGPLGALNILELSKVIGGFRFRLKWR